MPDGHEADPLRASQSALRQPVFLAAIFYSFGILIGWYAWRPPMWWLAGSLACVAAAAYFLRRRVTLAAILVSMTVVTLGALGIGLRPVPQGPPSAFLDLTDGRELTVTGYVMRDGTLRPGSFGSQRQVVDVETEEIRTGDRVIPISAGIRLNVYSPTARDGDDDNTAAVPAEAFRYGQRLRFITKLRPPRNFDNPGALDYRSYLQEQGIAALGSTRADSIEILPGTAGSTLSRWRSAFRHGLLDRAALLWSDRDSALLAAMVIGERRSIDRTTRLNFQRTGAYHVLVVSGLNVGILAFFLLWCLRRLRVPEFPATTIAVALAAAYAYITDAGAPILRATLMLAIYLGARLLYRDRAPLNALGTAALVLLVFEPRWLFDAGFQLTFLSVFAIVGLCLPLLERISEPYRKGLRYIDSEMYDLTLPPRVAQSRLDLRLIAERIARALPFSNGNPRSPHDSAATAMRHSRWALSMLGAWTLATFDVLLISAIMQLALALPMGAWFHRATVLALPANALVIPLAGLLMPLSIVTLGIAYLSVVVARVPASLTAATLHLMTGTVTFLGGIRTSDLRVPTPTTLVAIFASAAVMLAFLTARRRGRSVIAGTAIMCVAAAWISFVPPRPQVHHGVLEVTMLDVGQSESLLIVTPSGRTLLIDAAGSFGSATSEFDFGENVVSPYLWSRGIARLDAVALTHAHADHIGGMHSVVANFRPRELWVGRNPETMHYRALLAQAEEQGIEVRQRLDGETFEFGGAHFEVLGPPRDWSLGKAPRNNDSMVLRVSYGSTAALLEGDAEQKLERWIAARQPHADLLKVGHNGSATSTTPELVAAVQPRYAAISVGYRNRFGHPRPQVLDRLAAAHVSIFRTDTEGALTFLLDGRSVTPMLPSRQ